MFLKWFCSDLHSIDAIKGHGGFLNDAEECLKRMVKMITMQARLYSWKVRLLAKSSHCVLKCQNYANPSKEALLWNPDLDRNPEDPIERDAGSVENDLE